MEAMSQAVQLVAEDYTNKVAMADLAECKRTLNNGSRSFLAASHLLPAQTRDAATALYAFCRDADDIVDEAGREDKPLSVVGGRIDDIYRGSPQDFAADRALASVAKHYYLPRTILDAMLEGFSWDARGRVYENFDDVIDYAARVAGTVGAMMVLLMGVREPRVVSRACDLGVAMQLTNICRDVGEDARAGRCYLPRSWLREQGIDVEKWLAKPEFNRGIQRTVSKLLREADLLYKRADAGIAELPRGCQRGIRAARLLYCAIGGQVARQNFNSVDSRAVVNSQEKLYWLAKTLSPLNADRALLDLQPLQGNRFLVEAVTAAKPPRAISTTHGLLEATHKAREEMGAVIDLLGRIESERRSDARKLGRIPLQPMQSSISEV